MIFLKKCGRFLRLKCMAHQKSYSQCGEDCIIRFLFDTMGIENPSYLDIGANHPFYLSNTAMFYASGSHGVNVEPNPLLFRKIQSSRKRDLNLQMGIGREKGEMQFFILDADALSTFSEQEAERCVRLGHKIEKVLNVPVETLQGLIEKYCHGVFPDFLSLDTEGFDEIIIEDLTHLSSLPKVICVETLSYTTQDKNTETISARLLPLGYTLYANNEINSIFTLERDLHFHRDQRAASVSSAQKILKLVKTYRGWWKK